MESTERNASASANINSLKRMKQQRDHHRKRAEQAAENSKLSGFLGIIDSRSHWKIGSKAIAKKETTRRTTLSYSSGHKELASFCSREFHVHDAVHVNTSQEATEKAGQSSVLDHREDPRVIDNGTGSGKLSQKDT